MNIVEDRSAVDKYLNAIVSNDCDFESVAAKITILAFPIIVLVALLIDLFSSRHIVLEDQVQPQKLINQNNFIHKAINYLSEHPENSIAYSDALKYFNKCLQCNNESVVVKLPDFFHATTNGRNVSSILSKQEIFQNQAVRGYGSYVSTADEAGQVFGFGRYTFALDEAAIIHKPGAFFVPNPEGGVCSVIFNRLLGWKSPSIWVRVEANIPVNKHSVAYIGYPGEEEHTGRAERNEIQRKFPWVNWMNRKTSEKVCEVFRAVQVRDLPHEWRWMENMPHYRLPEHVRHIA